MHVVQCSIRNPAEADEHCLSIEYNCAVQILLYKITASMSHHQVANQLFFCGASLFFELSRKDQQDLRQKMAESLT